MAEIVILLLITYTPIGNDFFGTTPVPASDWVLVLPFAISLFTLEEVRKWIVRRVTSQK